MSLDLNSRVQRVASKAAKVAELNAAMRMRIQELEDQVVHLQESLTAMQAEHHELQEQLQQRDLALTVHRGSPARDTYSEEKISELIREIDRCMKLLSA
jgi:TolA-binding protein